jgi:LuxR family transcriptional regulator, maltose regulon positive regulatory protein
MSAPGNLTTGSGTVHVAAASLRQQAHARDRWPGFNLLGSKLLRPLPRSGTVPRSSLIERLAREPLCPVVSVVAPPGYGKTTLLSQWAEQNGEAFAWVSVDERDNDPKVLLRYIAEALDAVEPINERVFEALISPHSSVPGSVVPRLGAALWSMSVPVVLVLDDVHLLRNSECRAALSVLADHVPGGSRLVFAGRTRPPLRVARLRAEGRIAEIGPAELSLTAQEAAALLRDAGLSLDEETVAQLHRRTEGWPVGLYLAALCLREGGPAGTAAVSFGGDDRLVSEYLESEFLARISPRQRVFLTRTAALEKLSGPLCDAVLEQPDAAATLEDLAASNLLLVPLDRRGQWYRYHHLFRDMLLAELERREPGLLPVLCRRAARWCLHNSLPEDALEYSIAAGDVGTVAHLAEKLTVPTYQQGRRTTPQRWLRWLEDRGGIEGHPMAAVMTAVVYAMTGRPAEAERWADVVDRWQYGETIRPGDPAAEAWAAVLRVVMCRSGVEQMRADADDAVRRSAVAASAPQAVLYRGIALLLSGDLEAAEASFEDAASIGAQTTAQEATAHALCQRSLLAMARGEWDQAEVLAGQARAVLSRTGIETPLLSAAHARIAVHRGDVPAARRELVSAQRLRPGLTYARPHTAVQSRIELIRVHLTLSDLAGAKTLIREIDEVLKRRPGLGILAGQAKALRDQLSRQHDPSAAGASALTAAELRLLPMLPTHLSFAEIGAEFSLSRYTIKSHANSVYRKLGVSTRSQAITRAHELGILEGDDRLSPRHGQAAWPGPSPTVRLSGQ